MHKDPTKPHKGSYSDSQYIRKEGEGQFKKDQILIRLMNDMTLTASHEHASLLWLMVFNATFNNISLILWRSVLLVEETRENCRPVASQRQTLSHNVVLSTHCHEQGSIPQL